MIAKRRRTISARLWWATLPYEGCLAYPNPERPTPPWVYPLAWLNRLAARMPGFAAFEPMPPVECNCDYCLGVPGAVYEP